MKRWILLAAIGLPMSLSAGIPADHLRQVVEICAQGCVVQTLEQAEQLADRMRRLELAVRGKADCV